MTFIKGSIKNYTARNLQVITVFKEGFLTGCYCEVRYKRIHGEYLIWCVTKICHLHKPIKQKSKNPDKDISESSIRRSKSKILDYAMADYFDYFLTLTFDPKKVDSKDHELTKKLLSKWLNNFRRQHPDLKYVLVPELHKSGAIHFHGLFKGIDKTKAGITPATSDTKRFKKDKGGRQIYNMKKYGYGFSTVVELDDNPATAYYITKYIKKEMLQNAVLNKKRYWVSRGLSKSFSYTFDDISKVDELKYTGLGVISTFEAKYYTRITRSTVLDYVNLVTEKPPDKRKKRYKVGAL